MKKSDISGASVSMGEDKIKGSIITNLDQSFQGRVAGVTSVATSGAPGSSTSIRVRGQATINAGAEPLYVIDGVIFQGGGSSGGSLGLGDALGNGSVSTVSPMSTINPADIVSMEILKMPLPLPFMVHRVQTVSFSSLLREVNLERRNLHTMVWWHGNTKVNVLTFSTYVSSLNTTTTL